MSIPTSAEIEHLAAARVGKSEAFDPLFTPHRPALLTHCYRLSGSLDDAEDLVQETFVRAWNKIDTFEGRGPFRHWLYIIASRLWLDEVRRRKKRLLLPLDGTPADPDAPPSPPAAPGAWLDPLPDAWLAGADPSPESTIERRESISLAFMIALQKLNARQRVVLILRTVFNWSAEDVAEALELTVASVNNLLYRARKNLAAAQFEEMAAPKPQLDRFVSAWEAGDVHSLIELLHEKATFAMPPMGVWYAGRAAIAQALQQFVFMPGVAWKLQSTIANGRPAFGIYQQQGDAPGYQAFCLILPVFGADDGLIREVTAFLDPRLVTRCGLPPTLP